MAEQMKYTKPRLRERSLTRLRLFIPVSLIRSVLEESCGMLSLTAGASVRAGGHFESLRYSQRKPALKIPIAGSHKNGDSRCQRGISMPSPMTEIATRTIVG